MGKRVLESKFHDLAVETMKKMNVNEMDRQDAEHFFPGERHKLLQRDAVKYKTVEL